MKALPKTLLALLILILVALLAFLIWFQASGSQVLMQTLQEQAQKAGYTLEVEKDSLRVIPLRWVWSGMRLEKADGSLSVLQEQMFLKVGFNPLALFTSAPFISVHLKLDQPQVRWTAVEAAPESRPPADGQPPGPGAALPVDVGLGLSVENGSFYFVSEEEEAQSVENIDLEIQLPSLKQAYRNFSEPPAEPRADVLGELKATLALVGPVQTNFELGMAGAALHLLKLNVHVAGLMLQGSGAYQLSTGAQNWQLQASSSSLSEVPTSDLPVVFQDGDLNFSANIEKQPQAPWQGQAQLQAQDVTAQVSYESEEGVSLKGPIELQAKVEAEISEGQLTPQPFALTFNFPELVIRFKDLFSKPAQVPGSVQLAGQLGQSELSLTQGEIRLGSLLLNTELVARSFQENPTFSARLTLPPTEAGALRTLFPPLSEAPASGTVRARMSLQGPLFPVEKWQVKLENLQLSNFQAGVNYQNESLLAKGSVSADGNLSAETVFTDLRAAQGKLQANLTALELAWESRAAKKAGTPFQLTLEGQVRPPQGADPSTMVQAAVATYKAELAEITYDNMAIKGLSTQGRYDKGVVSGTAQVQSVFSGSAEAKSYTLDTRKSPMTFQAALSTRQVNLQQVTGWLAPDWQESVGGLLNSNLQLSSPLPLPEEGALRVLRAEGNFQIHNFTLKSGRIDQMIRDRLNRLANIGNRVELKEQTVRAEVSGQVNLQRGQMALSQAKMTTTAGDEITAEGVVTADQSLNLRAFAHLADPPVRGSILAANSDSQGRLLVPVTIEGTLSDPSPRLLESTVQTLLQNTVEHEIKQRTEKVEKDLKENLEKEAKKLFEGLFN